MKLKLKQPKPTRNELCGLNASQFKTLLKLRGFKIPRNFYRCGSVAFKGGRLYRFRWWNTEYCNAEYFPIDISCHRLEFDRWANSVYKVISFKEFLND